MCLCSSNGFQHQAQHLNPVTPQEQHPVNVSHFSRFSCASVIQTLMRSVLGFCGRCYVRVTKARQAVSRGMLREPRSRPRVDHPLDLKKPETGVTKKALHEWCRSACAQHHRVRWFEQYRRTRSSSRSALCFTVTPIVSTKLCIHVSTLKH